MRSSNDRESATYTRSALICFVCVGICLYFDIQKYTKTGFTFDREFFISLVFYVLLTVLGILSQRYLPVYRQVGVGICQRFAWSTGVICQISHAGEGRHREYEGNCQNKREDLRHQAGSSVLHSCLLILLILCYFGS